MRLRSTLCALTLVAGVSSAPSATAAGLVLLEDLRVLRAEEFSIPLDCGEVTPSSPFASFTADHGCIHGDVTQSSTADTRALAGLGYIATTGGGHSLDLEYRYAIRFTVVEPTPFVFDASFSFRGFDEGFFDLSAEALARLTNESTSSLVFEFDPPFVTTGLILRLEELPTLLSASGSLLPGNTYLFEVVQSSIALPFATANFDFQFVVSEPATGTLLSGALVCLGLYRRRAHHHGDSSGPTS